MKFKYNKTTKDVFSPMAIAFNCGVQSVTVIILEPEGAGYQLLAFSPSGRLTDVQSMEDNGWKCVDWEGQND